MYKEKCQNAKRNVEFQRAWFFEYSEDQVHKYKDLEFNKINTNKYT